MPTRSPRRDGFAGQHMIVLPEPERDRARRHALLRGLYVTDAGYFPAAADHFVERSHGAATTLVVLCLRGAGWFRFDGEERDVHAGDLVWLSARQPHSYGAKEEDPWTIAWAHFAGDEVAAWHALLTSAAESRAPVMALPVDRLDEIALDRVYAALERGYALRHQVAATAALRRALSSVAELVVERRDVRSARERVAASIDALRHDWMRPHRLEELATSAGMSVTHYSA